MKGLLFLVSMMMLCNFANAQMLEKEAPQGFDKIRTGISNGKLDSFMYESKTYSILFRKIRFCGPLILSTGMCKPIIRSTTGLIPPTVSPLWRASKPL